PARADRRAPRSDASPAAGARRPGCRWCRAVPPGKKPTHAGGQANAIALDGTEFVRRPSGAWGEPISIPQLRITNLARGELNDRGARYHFGVHHGLEFYSCFRPGGINLVNKNFDRIGTIENPSAVIPRQCCVCFQRRGKLAL